MKTITVHVLDKNSSASMSETIVVSDDSVPDRIVTATRERIEKRKQEILDNVPFTKYYIETECFDDLSAEEKQILEDLDLEVDSFF